MGRTACTEPQCLYKGALYIYLYLYCTLRLPYRVYAFFLSRSCRTVESSWNVMVHGDAQEGKWRGNWRMEWVANKPVPFTLPQNMVYPPSLPLTSAASSRLNWRPRRFKWSRLFRRKTKSGFCTCAITFQLASTVVQGPSWQADSHSAC